MARLRIIRTAGPGEGGAATARLELPFERRQVTRQRVSLQPAGEAGLFLPRGTVLRDGDRLVAETGEIVEVRAAPEPVSTARTRDPRLLARAAYHLGNRHVWVQVGADALHYLRDHVLDEMVAGLGLDVTHELRPFEPEAGAYGHHGSHGDAGGQGHPHGHGHGHRHA